MSQPDVVQGAAADARAEHGLRPEDVLDVLRTPRTGRVFDLDIGRFPGMPHHPAQPGFDLVTYLSPGGAARERASRGQSPVVDEDNFGVVLELVTTSMHMGTHIDALSHVTAGDDSCGFGGFRASEHVGDRGVLAADVAGMAPLIARGVLLDVARARGVPVLPAGQPVEPADLQVAEEAAGVQVRPGDVVLVRTGQLSAWPEYEFGPEAGLGLDAALWLAERGPLAVGADNSAVEVLPSVVPGRSQPVHVELLVKRGIYLIEWLGLEELAAAKPRDFLFVCLPLKITGATGSLVRPVAVT